MTDINSEKFESYPGAEAMIKAIRENGGQLRKITSTLSERAGQTFPYQYVRKWIRSDSNLRKVMKRAQVKYIKDRMINMKNVMAIKRRLAHEEAVLKHRIKSFAIKHYAVKHDGTTRPPHPKQVLFHAEPSQGRVISGANRCISPDTLIYDPVKKSSSRIDTIDGKFHVIAWNGERLVRAIAEKPFLKGVDRLYEVVLADGQRIVCTKNHKLLTPTGYCEVRQLRQGSDVCVPSVALSEIHTDELPGKPCHSDGRDAEQWQAVSNRSRSNTSRVHVARSGQRFSHVSDAERPEGTPTLSPTIVEPVQKAHVLDDPRFLKTAQGFGCGCPACFYLSDERLPGELSTARVFSPSQDDVQERISYIVDADVPADKAGHNRSCQSISPPSTVDDSLRSSFSSPSETSTVSKISFLRVGPYYDLTVPVYHNYLTTSVLNKDFFIGMIHKNSGKSHAGIAEDVAHALGHRPWLPVTDPNYLVKVRVPNKGLIVGESFQEQVKKVLIAKLLGDQETGDPGLIPKDEIAETKKNPQGIITYIRIKNGSRIYLQSYDQDVDLFESADYDWVHFDEPPPRAIFIAVMRGLTDRKGRYWFTMTPLKEPWIYDEIYDNKSVKLYYFDIQDNVGYGLTQEGVDQFSDTLTDDEKEARLHGRYFHLTGLVYKSFSKDIHLKRRDRVLRVGNGKVPRHWGLWMHIDTHPQTPHHAVWMAIDQLQRKYMVGELKNGDVLNRIDPYCEALRVYEREFLGRYGDSIVRLIDPISKVLDPGREDAKCMADIFADNGFRCTSGSKNRDAAILLYQNELNYDLSMGHFPNLFILDDLPGIRFEMTHYIWDDHQNPKAAERLADKNKPRKKNDHFIEGIHRILLDEPYCSIEPEENLSERPPIAVGQNSITGY